MKTLITLSAAVLFLTGCGAAATPAPAPTTPANSVDAAPGPRPGDFRIDYQLSNGALPPPHAYTVDILIEGSGKGTAILKAAAANGPEQTWQETFDIAPKQMDAVHELMKRSGVLDGASAQPAANAPGAGSASMKVIADGKEVMISDSADGDKKNVVKALFGAVHALAAPAEGKLQAQYNAWVKTQP